MAENRKIPAIRFKGFNEAWEQRKLVDEAELFGGLTYSPNNVVKENGTLVLRSSNVKNDEIVSADNVYVDPNIVNSCNVKDGDVIVVVRNGSRSLIGKHAQIKGDMNNTVIGAFMTGIRSAHPAFINALLNTQAFDREVEKNLGATINQITNGTFQQMKFMFPKSEEQNRIGEMFTHLDNLITLHQRKLLKIKNIKKAMLEKMFPKNGQSTPEIRFNGFTDAWEQRKLSAIADQTYGGGTPRTSVDEFWNGDIPWIQSSDLTDGKIFGVIPNKMISASGLKNSATKLVPEYSIAIITRVGVGKLAFMPFAYATSQDFLSLSKLNIDPWFGVYSCYKKLQSELHAVQGTSIKGITKDELLEKVISVPCINEQRQIGHFFQNLDNLITLHQRKLDKLNNIKRACLEKMFI